METGNLPYGENSEARGVGETGIASPVAVPPVRAERQGAVADLFPVIVVYCCKCTDARSYQTLVRPGGFREWMVYDNSPSSFQVDGNALPAGCVYVRDEANGGLSKAYNHAAAYAWERGYARLLLLDQDTAFAPDAVTAYAAADRSVPLWAPLVQTEGGAAFSPGDVRGWRIKAVSLSAGLYSLRDYYPVNSGMCVSLEAFRRAGGYNATVRLDFADYQFLQRLRKVDARFLLLPATALQDFSGNEQDADKLLARFRLYLDSACACTFDACSARLAHACAVSLHALSLFRKTRRWAFLKLWLIKYILRR